MATLALDRPRAVAARAPVVEGLFFATVFTVTFAKLQWEVAGTLSFSDVVTLLFLFAFAVHRLERLDGRMTRAAWITLAFFAAFLLVYLIGFLTSTRTSRSRSGRRGWSSSSSTSCSSSPGSR